MLLTSSEPQGIAYIETAQLDGYKYIYNKIYNSFNFFLKKNYIWISETNLKIRQAPGETVDWQSEKQLMKMNAVIK